MSCKKMTRETYGPWLGIIAQDELPRLRAAADRVLARADNSKLKASQLGVPGDPFAPP